MLKLTLNSLEKFFTDSQNFLLVHFQEGLTRGEIDKLARSCHLTFSHEMHQLYKWKNGINFNTLPDKTDPNLFPLATFFPLEKSLDYYRYYTKSKKLWRDGLFPVFNNAGGDFFLVDTDENSEFYKMIFFFCPSDPLINGMITFADSMNKLFSAVLECYKEKAFFYTFYGNTQFLNSISENEKEIFKRFNPKSEYWLKI